MTESTRGHILEAIVKLRDLRRRAVEGADQMRSMLEARAFLAAELAWADRQALTDEDKLLTKYRVRILHALTLTERSFEGLPEDDGSAALAAAATSEILELVHELEPAGPPN